MATITDNLILSKSLALIEKTRTSILQIDTSAFPTPSSGTARKMLLDTLDSLADPKFWSPMSPEALLNVLLSMQQMVELLERSSSAHISWPLVSYCDRFCKLIFASSPDVEIFYSVCSDHNYWMESFAYRLKTLLRRVLPPEEIERLLDGRQLYCLQIASVEDENLPLYANLGHEFGHALDWSDTNRLARIVENECFPTLVAIREEMEKTNKHAAARSVPRLGQIVRSLATELFCDQVGALIAGPAFLLSLHEIGWGSSMGSWVVRLIPKDANIKAYPSFAFRLACVRGFIDLPTFRAGMANRTEPLFTSIPELLSHTDEAHDSDTVIVKPESEQDASALRSAMEKQLPALKQALHAVLKRTAAEMLAPLRDLAEFQPCNGNHVVELIRRLLADIVPNIIPNGTLLGERASFSAILNASALHRMRLLSERKTETSARDMHRTIQKLDRLTAKAFEVSYIQGEFKKWEAENRERSKQT
ncbi:hypothetical protein [Prosthecobacter sp.]|uniref:hypothetical protein n=1 Tax=Prosthecobacter sp. TaxID=1965333 RepID=UPI002AB82F58|nr:hypothetical protein [Prosthecobacter sp.]MDZ4404191.1 hypothetical protein [Prosthecobacter sp.]